MRRSIWILGVLAAIVITTAMDACGLSAFSALPLFPLLILLWYLERISRAEIGFVLGHRRHYGLAVIYPLIIIGITFLIATLSRVVELGETNWGKSLLNLTLIIVSTITVSIITEEGFFRGWLWASLQRIGWNEKRILLVSSIAFSLWHLSAISLDTGFDLPTKQIPIFLVNAAVIGGIWGMMRSISGSVIVASVSHGIWNGLAYVFFGFGTKVGALGINETIIFGPEVGILGLFLNLTFAIVLWRRWQEQGRESGPEVA